MPNVLIISGLKNILKNVWQYEIFFVYCVTIES
jgi:hypothetical protein